MTILHVSSNLSPREALIYSAVRHAVTSLGVVGRPEADLISKDRPLGLSQRYATQPLIALGMVAHKDLADVWKRTLVATDVMIPDEAERAKGTDADLERLFWSCCNTYRLVALGLDTWQSAQGLPLNDCQYFDVPPIRVPAALSVGSLDIVRIINHDENDRRACLLATEMTLTGTADVRLTGTEGNISPDFSQPFYSGAGAFDVHVGNHTINTHRMRILDSLASGSIVLHLANSVTARSQLGERISWLTVDDGSTGFIGSTLESIKRTYKQIRLDHVLRRQIIDRGRASVATLRSGWGTIALNLMGQ